jgi:hypothetical protein
VCDLGWDGWMGLVMRNWEGRGGGQCWNMGREINDLRALDCAYLLYRHPPSPPRFFLELRAGLA